MSFSFCYLNKKYDIKISNYISLENGRYTVYQSFCNGNCVERDIGFGLTLLHGSNF